jgi:2-oxoglutarate decarboxylase
VHDPADDSVTREPIRGASAMLVQNMNNSTSIPDGTTFRTFEVEELMSLHAALRAAGTPVPLGALLGYALSQAVGDVPSLLDQYVYDGRPYRIRNTRVNLAIAVDVEAAGGRRGILAPVITDAGARTLPEFVTEYVRLVEAARTRRLQPADLRGANLMFSSTAKFGSTGGVPRLPPGPAVIVSAGAIGYPPGLSSLAGSLPIARILTLSCTYDHRVVQGADSGAFLSAVERHLTAELDAREVIDAFALGSRSRSVRVVNLDRVEPTKREDYWRLLDPLLVPADAAGAVGTVLVESAHADPATQRWCSAEASTATPDDEARCQASRLLSQADAFERYLQKQFIGEKTLSIEGIDASLIAVTEIAALAASLACEQVVIGMAHRGRLNVMAHVLNWSYGRILKEFEQEPAADTIGMGDVRQHLGGTGVFKSYTGDEISVRLEPNPSHLEFVTAVALGSARAEQEACRRRAGLTIGEAQRRVVPVMLHGDAAFTGQGVVAECLNMRSLPAYDVGGTIHIVQDNQLGFTATANELRSTRWPSDIVKGYGAPILHVNADDIDAAICAARLATRLRSEERCDVVIHLVGYRRLGHNEGDEPRYTQPKMYELIDHVEPVYKSYHARLAAEGKVAPGADEDVWRATQAQLADARSGVAAIAAVRDGRYPRPVDFPPPGTGSAESLDVPYLERLLDELETVPTGFSAHRKYVTQLERRRAGRSQSRLVDWAEAEALAFATLADAGHDVRLTGQDVERGTFSQRHAVLHDVTTGARHQRWGAASHGGHIDVFNSPLTEMATLAFEYGMSRTDPDRIVAWEAQFGDFANGAQVIIDQFICAGATKWGMPCRLAMLLPHGYEGAGPEHSSARIERFLDLCADNNMMVAQATTAGQYFALLRQHARSALPRPAVIFTPKSLLRSPAAQTPIGELARDAFCPLIMEALPGGDRASTRLVLCSGKVCYELRAELSRAARGDVTLARVERFYPFPDEELAGLLSRHPEVREVVWAQEEPVNMGAWRFVSLHLLERDLLGGRSLGYVARPASASPAEGYRADHTRNQTRIVTEACTVGSADGWLIRPRAN